MLISMKFNMYLFGLIMGTFLACSASSWFTAWLGLEINLLSLIPLIITQLNPYSSETSIKYFIAQALASMIIIFVSIVSFYLNSISPNFLVNSLILLALSIKMGAAPFHFWLPQVIQTAKWIQVIIILTWQKIAPMILMIFLKTNFIKMMIISSCLVGALGAINQIIIKKILVYSSILHTSWLLSSLLCSELIWLFYFSLYSIISISVISSLMFSNFKKIKNIFFSNLNPIMAFIIFLNLLSMAGIPPFLGFLMKLTVIFSLINLNFDPSILMILIISSLVSLFYYLRMIFSSMILSIKFNKLLTFKPLKTPNNFLLLSFSSIANILFPFILIFI